MSTYYASAIGLGDIFDSVKRFLIGTRCFQSPVLAIGTTVQKVKTSSAINFCIDGIMYALGATDDAFVHTDVTVQPAYTTKYYLLSVNAAGTCLITQGNAYTTDSTGLIVTSLTGPAKLPPCPAANCPIGYIKIVTAATGFTPATTSHATLTTYVNMSALPVAALA
jgi:hypothetical protein